MKDILEPELRTSFYSHTAGEASALGGAAKCQAHCVASGQKSCLCMSVQWLGWKKRAVKKL